MQFTPLSDSKLSTPSLSYKNMPPPPAPTAALYLGKPGFRVQSANHYTMGPYSFSVKENYQVEPLIATDFFIAYLDLRWGSTHLYKDFVQSIE